MTAPYICLALVIAFAVGYGFGRWCERVNTMEGMD